MCPSKCVYDLFTLVLCRFQFIIEVHARAKGETDFAMANII